MIFSNFEGRVASARNFPAKMMKKVVPGKNLSKFYLTMGVVIEIFAKYPGGRT